MEVVQADAAEPPENKVSRTIDRLLAEAVPMSHITLLSPSPWTESCAARLPQHIQRDLLQMDEFNLREFPPPQISFAQIQDFKGLENTAIILLDLDRGHFDQHPSPLLYVGMSRARAYLALVMNP